MNNPQFYIFGVPDGFDIYNATPEKKNFFLSFYDGKYTGRSLMMVIYRNEDNNEVTYVYFRGNILAADRRPGSFLGMALTFQNGLYCTNAKLVHDLFEGMYIAVSNNKLLTTNVTNSQCQAQFLISKFVEQTSNIAALEQFVARQVAGWPAGSLDQIDSTFSSDPRSIELDMRNISWEHVIPNMKAVSWVYLTGLTAYVPPVQQTKPQPAHDTERGRENVVVNKTNNQWPSDGGRTQSQTISQKRESTSTSSANHPYEQSYEERLKRLVSDVQFELGTNYNNSIKSLQQRVRIMNTLKERVLKLKKEQPRDKTLDKQLERIEDEVNNISTRIAAAEKRKRIFILALLAIVALIILVFSINKCSDKTPPPEEPGDSLIDESVNKLNNRVAILMDTIISYKDSLKSISDEKRNQSSYSKADSELKKAENYLNEAKKDLSRTMPLVGAAEGRLKKAENSIKLFKANWNNVKKMPDNKKPSTANAKNNVDKKPQPGQGTQGQTRQNPSATSLSPTDWSWKITGNGIGTIWSQYEIQIPTKVPITITVYNNGTLTPVLWDYTPAITVQTQNVLGNKGEVHTITITKDERRGKISFYPKGHRDQMITITLQPEQ